jgi:hypothetical protein
MASGKAIVGMHLVRYGTASDQCYLLGDFLKTYNQLVINANILAHMPSAMSDFVALKAKKPYFIDPQTHALQHSLEHLLSTSKKSNGTIKRSWSSLLEAYGEPVYQIIAKDHRPVLPTDFNKKSERKAFCRRVIEFQKNKISDSLTSGKDSKYFKYLAKTKAGEQSIAKYPPSLVVAPYFFISTQFFNDWLTVNLNCLEDARTVLSESKDSIPLAAQIVISKDFLYETKLIDELVAAYTNSIAKPEVFLLWIDDFKEEEQPASILKNYQELISKLAKNKIEVAVLYGGFFSISSAIHGNLKNKLTGICHGLEYGESKSVVPVTGGIPVAKYYLPCLHSRLPARVAYFSIKELGGFNNPQSFHKKICDCKTCTSVITKSATTDFSKYTNTKPSTFWRAGRRVAMDFPTAETSDLCTKHYMLCKYREYQDNRSLTELRKELISTYTVLKEKIGLDYVGHAQVWSDSL